MITILKRLLHINRKKFCYDLFINNFASVDAEEAIKLYIYIYIYIMYKMMIEFQNLKKKYRLG